MKILFVHQSFPGQYRHILRALDRQGGHQIVGLGISNLSEALPASVHYFRYSLGRGNTPGIHNWLTDVDSKLIRGEACATAAAELRDKGFIPDIICSHPGWGEALFLRDVWPGVPLLCYQSSIIIHMVLTLILTPSYKFPDWKSCAALRLKMQTLC